MPLIGGGAAANLFGTGADRICNVSKFADYATTTNLPAYTASGAGPGKTLTANANGTLTIDGTVQAAGNFILVKDATSVDCGLYAMSSTGSGGSPWVLTRATNYDNDLADGIVPYQTTIYVNSGTTNKRTIWRFENWVTYVMAASTANITTLAGYLVVDGYQTKEGDLVLMKNQSNQHQNAVYIVHNNAWERDPETLEFSEPNVYVAVTAGTTNAGTRWRASVTDLSGTVNITWASTTHLYVVDTDDTFYGKIPWGGRDLFFEDLSFDLSGGVPASFTEVTLKTNGFRVYSRNRLQVDTGATADVSLVFSNDGGSANGPFVVGAGGLSGTLGGGMDGAVGTSDGANGQNGNAAPTDTTIGGTSGGAGGVVGHPGGLAAQAVFDFTAWRSWLGMDTLTTMMTEKVLVTSTPVVRSPLWGGNGGPSGGSLASGDNSGAGGGGGGLQQFVAPKMIFNVGQTSAALIFSAQGGVGGNGDGVNAGGGGGGGGGGIIMAHGGVYSRSGAGAISFLVNGGSGGMGLGSGGNGGKGVDGRTIIISLADGRIQYGNTGYDSV